MPKVSVIIPVYNVADKIIRCIDSLLAQTLEDVEFILVDDHGQDNSIDMAKQHIANHKQVNQFVFTETPVNSGPGIARNVGMELAKGDYVAFCDADDWVEPTMLEQLYKVTETNRQDFVYCDAVQHIGVQQNLLVNLDFKSSKYYLTHFVAYLWTYLFKRDFLVLNHVSFASSRSSEDSCFIASCILLAEQVTHIKQALYHYVVYSKSVSHKVDKSRFAQKKIAFSHLFRFAKEHDLMKTYRWQLYFVYFKKAIVTSIIDYFKSL
ncbi:MAG: glycosyltransferase [Sphingobacteriia bacterium]|nr:glycosyltransferase [Sphingobacteriia bacterium]